MLSTRAPLTRETNLVIAGSPCNDFQGYCDTLLKCRSIDTNGPLARIRQLLLSEATLTSIRRWVIVYWYAVLLMAVGFVLLMAAFIQVCAVHTPSSNPNRKPARKITDTLVSVPFTSLLSFISCLYLLTLSYILPLPPYSLLYPAFTSLLSLISYLYLLTLSYILPLPPYSLLYPTFTSLLSLISYLYLLTLSYILPLPPYSLLYPTFTSLLSLTSYLYLLTLSYILPLPPYSLLYPTFTSLLSYILPLPP